jgi:phosphate uptake regulator
VFRFLRDLFSADNLLRQAFDATAKMLRDDYTMFEESIRTLRHSDTAELKFDIFAADKKINKYEREVRRKVLAHLALGQTADVASGLVLISVVIDVERIGDYTKNIAELAQAHPQRLDGMKYEDELTEVENAILERFNKVSEAYAQSDEELAASLMTEHRDISGWCDKVTKELIGKPPQDVVTGQAVALALYVRHLKRISAHLTNIVSSVVNPFPRIGYRQKKSDRPT